MRDVAPGLWLWRQPHPDWGRAPTGSRRWRRSPSSRAAPRVLLDPLAPPPGARDVWARLDALRPEAVVVLKPDHVRDVDLFVRWYGAARLRAVALLARRRAAHRAASRSDPGDELPGGLQAHHDGRGQMETPIYLPEQRALVFADALTAPDGVLRVWATPWHEERTLPALRALLALPFEHVLVSHGEPVHARADFEAALEREPWSS